MAFTNEVAMRLRQAYFAFMMAVCFGAAHKAWAGPFRFQDLEHYYLYDYGSPDSYDPAQTQLSEYAVQYVEKHFPLGSSAPDAASALEAAGAKCSIDDDARDGPPGFVCDWSRRDYGLDFFCCEIDWIVGLETGQDNKKILGVVASRTESGP